MALGTNIEWADATWNPTAGCSRVSPGCENCYAERFAGRFRGPGGRYEGLVVLGKNGPRWTGVVQLVASQLDRPLRWKKPRRIFVNSMSDLFHEDLSNEEIAAVFGVMAASPQHTFQVLTKRAARMRQWFDWLQRIATPEPWTECHAAALAFEMRTLGDSGPIHMKSGGAPGRPWPLSNVWLGVSVEDQQNADARIPDLLATPAAVRWVSAEPLLGPVNLAPWLYRGTGASALSWVVAGSESGPGARPMDIAWMRSLREQCRVAGVPFFTKQISNADDHKGGDPVYWPPGPWPREFPSTAAT